MPHGLRDAHPSSWERHHVLPVKGVRSDRSVNEFIRSLSTEPSPDIRIRHLVREIKKSPHQFSGSQTVLLAPHFSSNLILALHLLDHHLLGVTCLEAAKIIRLIIASEQKLEALKVLCEHLLDPVNRQELLTAFPNIPVLRQQVNSILMQVRGSSHVYGRIKAKNVIFLIDISGSMHTEFASECGTEFDRLEYVVHDLHKILHHRVPPEFRFNIFTFNSDTRKWKPYLQNAYPTTLRDAEHYLDHLHAHGGTNTHDALREALRDNEADAIYLLSDGEPTSGITNADTIINDLRLWISQRTRPVQIHTVAFLLGHETNDPAPRRLMAGIASVGGGVFRCLDPHASDHEEHGDFLDGDDGANDVDNFDDYFNQRIAALPPSIAATLNAPNLPPPPNWKGSLITKPRIERDLIVGKVTELKGHHYYETQLTLAELTPYKPNVTWTVSITFNDLKEFHKKAKVQIGAIPLPPDPTFAFHNKSFYEQRRRDIEVYLRKVYVNVGPFASADLNDLLLYDANVDEAIAEASDLYQAAQLQQLQQQPPVMMQPQAQPPPTFALSQSNGAYFNPPPNGNPNYNPANPNYNISNNGNPMTNSSSGTLYYSNGTASQNYTMSNSGNITNSGHFTNPQNFSVNPYNDPNGNPMNNSASTGTYYSTQTNVSGNFTFSQTSSANNSTNNSTYNLPPYNPNYAPN